jgi:RHS repeat-associated protein
MSVLSVHFGRATAWHRAVVFPVAMALVVSGFVAADAARGAGRTVGEHLAAVPGSSTSATVVAAANTNSLGTGSVWAWGDNGYGALGNGTTMPSSVPVSVSGLAGVTAIAAAQHGGYALRSDGTVWAWGDNGFGQLGDGTTTARTVPVQVSGLTGVTAVAAAGSVGYALRADGTVWAWGYNYNNELGDGTATNSNTAVQVSGLTGVTAIGGRLDGGFAVRSDGTVWAWGSNYCGALGNGTTTPSSVPVQVSGLTDVTAAAGGEYGGYALRSDGTVWAWGCNYYGELGNGTTTASSVPVQVSGLTAVGAIAAGDVAGYALRSDGTVWAWGDAISLGNGTTTNSSIPVPVSGLTGITAVSGGGEIASALRSDGTVWDWGDNSAGQLGNGEQWTLSYLPVKVSGLVGVRSIASGGYSGFALGGVMVPVDAAVLARELPGANPCLSCSATAARAKRADPVDTAAGSFGESFVDLAISGRGPQAVWARSYSSVMAADDGPLGFGWHTGYGAHLVIDGASGNITVSQENGAEVAFTNTTGVLAALPRVQATLAKNGDGSYTFVRQASQTLKFTTAGVLTSIGDRNGETTTLAYAGGKLATITEPGGRALTVTYTGTHITKVSDPQSHSVSYTYDAAGNLASVTGPDGAVTTFGYDGAHHLTSILDPAQQSAPIKHPLTMVYDAQGRVTSQADPLGRATTFVYTDDPFSATGGSTLTTNPAGHQQQDSYQYGVRTSSIEGYGTTSAVTTAFTYDPVTLGVTSTSVSSANDPVTHVSSATYDAQGHPITQVDALGREVDTTYNSFGEPLTVTAPNSSSVGPAQVTTTNTYDAAGNALSVTRPLYTSATAFTNQVTTYQRATTAHREDVTGVVDPLGNTTVNTYDAVGNLTGSTSPQGRKTTSTYDAIGRQLTTVAPKGNVSGATASQFTTTYTYDSAGRLLSTGVANLSAPLVSSQTYDLDGRVLTATDGLNRVTKYAYDLAGQATLVTLPDATTRASTYWPDGALKTQVDGKTNTTSYAEDPLGRVASVTDALNRATAYTYDATGAVLTVTDPLNQVTTNAYDVAGQLASTTYSNAATHSAVRTYNAAGLPETLVDATGTTTSSYDSLGRLVTQVAPGGTVGYGYNLRNQITTLTYPNNKAVTRVYEADGAMTASTDWSSKKTTFTYDQNEAWTGGAAANAVTTTIGYDNAGRVTGTTIAKGTTTLGKLVYTLDAASQITTETSTSLGATRTFTNDAAGRVTKENTTLYSYDAAGELTKNGATTQGYDAASQLTTGVVGSTSTAYTFDARGDRTKATTGTTVATYGYDQVNRLTSYTRGTTTASYTYNGDGLRASKKVGSTTTKFVYDTAEGLPLVLSDGASFYLYGPDGVPFEQVTTAGVVTYLHADQLGSIRMITSSTGTSVGTATYTAYGTRTTAGTTSAFGYAGQYTDTETGLQWLRARYYDPATGQFLTVDPLTAATGARYAYAGGNPITGADPSGLWCGDWGVWCVVETAVIAVVLVAMVVLLCVTTACLGDAALAATGAVVADGVDTTVLTGAAAGAEAVPECVAADSVAGDLMDLGAKPSFTNPAESPGAGWEWRGTGEIGSPKGSWYSEATDESLHPDLAHPEPIGPHYDWRTGDGSWFRILPDGTVIPK